MDGLGEPLPAGRHDALRGRPHGLGEDVALVIEELVEGDTAQGEEVRAVGEYLSGDALGLPSLHPGQAGTGGVSLGHRGISGLLRLAAPRPLTLRLASRRLARRDVLFERVLGVEVAV